MKLFKITDEVLSELGFKQYEKTSPEICWQNSMGYNHIEAMKVNDGYWIILSIYQGGSERGRINLGKYVYKKDLVGTISSLKKGA